MRRFILPFYLALGACLPAIPAEVPSRAAPLQSTLPPIKSFAVPHPDPTLRSNADIARDFLDLAFRLESGRELPVLTRFEEPISLRLDGAPPPTMKSDLNKLLYRLRTEAGLDIALVRTGPADIVIEAVPKARIRHALPQAACFVVPNVSSLDEYRQRQRSPALDWTRLRSRKRLAVFVPNDVAPQEVRDCLHEEVAQALGPLNDLYRLPDSVFNDDNVHTVLTGFDMLILRTFYDRELRNGMSRAEVARVLPGILARLNPAGETRPAAAADPTPRAWIDAIQTALGPGARISERRRAAERALAIAKSRGWQDHRRAFSHYALGRLYQVSDPARAFNAFTLANAYYGKGPETALHRAHVASQLAAFALTQGDPETALSMIGPAISAAAHHENAALLATLLMMQAEALELAGRPDEARSVRLDSLGWARYGFGADWAVRARLREVASLNPLKRSRGI